LSSTLREELVERISSQRKITFREWMRTALYHSRWGYYNRSDRKRWGRRGDYRTSPERSELFAITFARYFATLYDLQGRPAVFRIVELGAGNGQFAIRVLETLEQRFPTFFNALQYTIVEAREDTTDLVEGLRRFSTHVDLNSLATLQPIEAGIVFSNELLDSFPVHIVRKVNGQLREIYVSLNDDGEFVWTTDELSSLELGQFCKDHLPSLLEGQTVEVNLEIRDLFQSLNTHLISGYLVTVDYGADAADLYTDPHRYNGTLRAFRDHAFVDDVLKSPGEQDITSTIDWSYVRSEGKQNGFETDRFEPLDKFLMSIGILDELETRLSAAASEAERSQLTTATREMILPGGMASSFQVLVQKR